MASHVDIILLWSIVQSSAVQDRWRPLVAFKLDGKWQGQFASGFGSGRGEGLWWHSPLVYWWTWWVAHTHAHTWINLVPLMSMMHSCLISVFLTEEPVNMEHRCAGSSCINEGNSWWMCISFGGFVYIEVPLGLPSLFTWILEWPGFTAPALPWEPIWEARTGIHRPSGWPCHPLYIAFCFFGNSRTTKPGGDAERGLSLFSCHTDGDVSSSVCPF